jgi:hypothetical protein
LFDLNGGQLTLSGAGNFIDFDDVEDGDLVVATSGSGTVTLAGTVPGLTGSVIVDSGTLVLDGDLAQAGLIVNGGTVKGTGSAQGMTFTAGTLSPGASPGIIVSAGDFTLAMDASFFVELNGTTPGTGHDQLQVTGSVTLVGALSGSALVPVVGSQFVIIDNDGVDPVFGTFAGLPEGALVTISGQPFTISYVGGTGNDVVLTAVDPNTTTTSTTTTSTTTTTTIAGGTTTTTTAGGTTTTTTAGGVTTTTTAGGATTTLTPTTTIAPAGGGLPPTGSNSSDGVQLAVLALLAGVVLIVVARRRLNTKGD